MHLFPPLSLQILFSPLLHSSAVFRNQKIRTVSPPPSPLPLSLSSSLPLISTGKTAADRTICLRCAKRVQHQTVLIHVGYISAKCQYFFLF